MVSVQITIDTSEESFENVFGTFLQVCAPIQN